MNRDTSSASALDEDWHILSGDVDLDSKFPVEDSGHLYWIFQLNTDDIVVTRLMICGIGSERNPILGITVGPGQLQFNLARERRIRFTGDNGLDNRPSIDGVRVIRQVGVATNISTRALIQVDRMGQLCITRIESDRNVSDGDTKARFKLISTNRPVLLSRTFVSRPSVGDLNGH